MRRTKISIVAMFILLIGLLAVISYYVLIDTQSEAPKEIEKQNEIEEYTYKERSIFVVKPQTSKSEKVVLYFHGGSYMAEASKAHWQFISDLANDAGVTVIMPDYPLTPKYDYEDVFKMIEPFYQELIKKVDNNNLVIMGDSAGGGLGLALEEKLGEQGIEMPAQTILISPWLDVKLENPEIEKYEEKDKELNKEALKLAGIAYSKDEGENYLVSPIKGNLKNLKNITIFIGTNDILNPDTKLLKEKATQQGVRRRNKNKRI